MKRTSIFISVLALLSFLTFTGCGESDCSLTTVSLARFDFLDSQTHGGVGITSGATITGIVQLEDTILTDTIYNKAETSMTLPLSYTNRTTYVMHYTETIRDTIELTHKNIPYVSDIECGTMMFYKVESVKYTTYALDSVVIINPNINNEEKKNFYIYFRVDSDE